MPVNPVQVPQDAMVRAAMVVRGKYKFSEDGGAVSTIAMTSGTPIPSGSTILGGWLEVVAAVTGAGASVAVQVEGAGDMVASAAISGAPWSTTGRKSIVPAFTGATAVRTTADRNISAVVSGAVVTAGEFDVVLLVVPPLA